MRLIDVHRQASDVLPVRGAGQSCADLVGVGVVELGEYLKGPLPGNAGRTEVTGRAVGVAEAHEGVSLVVAVAG